MQRSTKIAILRRFLRFFRIFPLETIFRSIIGLQYDLKTRRDQAPLVVYQMGKVGSQSIYQTLVSSSIRNPVYHIHQLSENSLQCAEQLFQRQKLWPPSAFLMYGQMLAGKLRDPNHVPWKIITLVREPIRTFFSHIFFNPKHYRPFLLDEKGCIVQKKVEKYIMDALVQYNPLTDYIASWFDKEFLPATGVDVYKHQFDTKSGYSIIHSEIDDILILRLESLNKCMSSAIGEFLSLNFPVLPKRSNANESSIYSDSYFRIRNEFVIPKDVLRNVYSSQYAQHFYTVSEIEEFIEYWAAIRS